MKYSKTFKNWVQIFKNIQRHEDTKAQRKIQPFNTICAYSCYLS
jgi:hypothetical protein